MTLLSSLTFLRSTSFNFFFLKVLSNKTQREERQEEGNSEMPLFYPCLPVAAPRTEIVTAVPRVLCLLLLFSYGTEVYTHLCMLFLISLLSFKLKGASNSSL